MQFIASLESCLVFFFSENNRPGFNPVPPCPIAWWIPGPLTLDHWNPWPLIEPRKPERIGCFWLLGRVGIPGRKREIKIGGPKEFCQRKEERNFLPVSKLNWGNSLDPNRILPNRRKLFWLGKFGKELPRKRKGGKPIL